MVLGALLLPVFFVLTFAVPPGLGPRHPASGCFVAFLRRPPRSACSRCRTSRCPPSSPHDYDARTRLLSGRVVVLTFAILLFGAGGPELRAPSAATSTLGYLVHGARRRARDRRRHAHRHVRRRRAGVPPPAARRARRSRRATPRASPRCDAAAPFRDPARHLRAAGARDRHHARGRAATSPTWVLHDERGAHASCSSRSSRPRRAVRADLGARRAPHRQGARRSRIATIAVRARRARA